MLIKIVLLALICSAALTACADPLVVYRTRVPHVEPALFELPPRPRLGPGDKSWIHLRIFGEAAVLWGAQCETRLHGVRDVLEEARRREAER